MAANVKPIFVATPRSSSIKLITAATDADGASSTLLFAADATNGSRIHAISVAYSGTVSSASVLRLFLKKASTYYIIAELDIPTYTAAAGVPATIMDVLDSSFLPYLDPADRFIALDPGAELYASLLVTVQANLHITAWGGDY